MRERNINLCLASKGSPPGSSLVRNHTQGVQITQRRRDFPHRLLGRKVLSCAHHHSRGGQSRLIIRARNTKIGQLHDAVGAHQNIRGLNITVDNPGFRRCAERHRDLHQYGDEVLRGNAMTVLQVVVEGLAFNQLHDDPAATILLARILHVRNIRVLDTHRIIRFDTQTRQGQLFARELRAQYLCSHHATGHLIASLPDLAHATLSNRREQRVATAQLLAC